MYFYCFREDGDTIRTITLDDTGLPETQSSKKISAYPETSEYAKLFKDNKNLLVFGEAMTPEELMNTQKTKPYIKLYLDHEVQQEIAELKSEQDWEDFFEDYEIESEIRRTPATYLFH
jgi:hypothetical protein